MDGELRLPGMEALEGIRDSDLRLKVRRNIIAVVLAIDENEGLLTEELLDRIPYPELLGITLRLMCELGFVGSSLEDEPETERERWGV